MRVGSFRPRLALSLGAGLALFAVACAPRAPSVKAAPPVAPPRTISFDDVLSHPADMIVTLHPPAIVRDRVYGPLLRKASAMAAAYAGPRTVGTTALAAIERTDEIVVAANDATTEAVIVLRGVPADLDAERIVDERAIPIWRQVVGDVGRSAVEYEPLTPTDAALFVLPRRTWVIAVGEAKARTREALLGPISPASLLGEDAPLAVLSMQGAAFVQRDARLRDGALAPVGHSLVRASFELAPGADGVIDARLVYADPSAARASEETTRDVVAAFRRRLESPKPPPLSWLAAAGVERAAAIVTVRAPLPKSWLEALAHADVAAPSTGDAGSRAPGTAARSDDLPWQLWHPAASSVGSVAAPTAPQEPSQIGRFPLTQTSP